MNNEKFSTVKAKINHLFGGRVKDILLIGVLAIIVFYTAWKIFEKDNDATDASQFALSENEVKIMRILQEIEGVGKASVVVCEEEDEVKGAVVVCEGANNLRVVMNIREAVAAALDTDQKSIKIYLKKE